MSLLASAGEHGPNFLLVDSRLSPALGPVVDHRQPLEGHSLQVHHVQNVPGEEVSTDVPILHHDLPVVRQVSPAYTLCSLDSRPADRDGIDEWYSIRTLECS